MLLQRKNGFVALPSVFSHSSKCSSRAESPPPSRSSTRNHQSFDTVTLGWRSTEKFLSPAQEVANGTSRSLELGHLRSPGRESLSPLHPLQDWSTTTQRRSGIGFSADAESSGGRSPSTIGRWHSLSRLPSHDSRVLGFAQPLARRRRSVSERDLRTCLLERVQKEAELAAILKESDCAPRGEMKELKKLEVDLNVMKFELLFLKQKMESSFAVLEREKTWLEMLSSGVRKRKWKRKDKVFPVQLELLKAKSYSGRRRNGLLSQDSNRNEDTRKKDVNRDMPALQENPVAREDAVPALEEEQEVVAQRLKSAGENDTAIALPQEKDWPSAQVMRLEGEIREPVLKPPPALSEREGQMPGIEPGTFCVQSRASSSEPRSFEMVPLELEHAQKNQEGSGDQMVVFHADLAGAKPQVSQEDPEKVLLKHKLESARQTPCEGSETERGLKKTALERTALDRNCGRPKITQQVPVEEWGIKPRFSRLESTNLNHYNLLALNDIANRDLSLEVAQSGQSLEVSLDSLHHSEAEKKLETHIEALENECARLLGEREGRSPEGQLDGPNREEELSTLQGTCENLRESQSLLQREKDHLETRGLELEAALRDQREEMERHLADQKQESQYWQDRWEWVAAALKTKEEELEKAHLQSQASSAQLETVRLLQNQLDDCQQDPALKRNLSWALHHYVQRQETGSQTSAAPMNEEAGTEVASVREELQKVWHVLKSRDTELEGKQLELEAARNQYAECSSEKARLDRLVASLEVQLTEREQALRRFEEARDEERAENEMKISLLEQKLAEMEAVQDSSRRGSDSAVETVEVRENLPGEGTGSPGTCRHCSATLTQLNQAIQSAEKREKEDQTLACLYRLRDLLKGSLPDWTPVPKLVQSPGQDPPAKVIRSPQEEKEILRHRHQLVTEQLKGLFRQRQQLEQSKQQPGGGKEERLQEPRKLREVQAASEFPRPLQEHPATPDVPGSTAEVQHLQKLLKEKTETISSMASEIQVLQQKNESLMKAKLRFQQQIQQIRNLPKQRPERSALELPVPRLSATLGQDSHSTQGSDSSVPSPQSDEPPFTGSREDLSQAAHRSQPRTGAEDPQRGSSPDEGAGQVPRAPPSPPIPAGPSSKPFSLELISSLQADSEGALVSPRGSALLSPRPFGPPRPWSPFKFRGSPDLPEGGEKH